MSADLKHDMGEMWLARRCGDFGHVFGGVTDPALRQQRIREAIREGALEETICGRGKDGRPETFREAYTRLYGEWTP
jgi:hypothetical protein